MPITINPTNHNPPIMPIATAADGTAIFVGGKRLTAPSILAPASIMASRLLV